MAFCVGAFIGGWLLTMLIGALLERFLFRDLAPQQRASFTIGTAWVICAILAGFGFADGNGFAVFAGLNYIPGALLSAFLFYRRYSRSWSAGEDGTV
jgi:hypothetical protein